jgi:hypothetical protein
MAALVDPNFDFTDRPVLHVPTPPGTGLPSGVAPNAITDPKLRSEYEMAIARNRAKTQRYNEQSWLKLNAEAFFRTAERYLLNAYSRSPKDPYELERLLKEYMIDPRVVERLLDAVKRHE